MTLRALRVDALVVIVNRDRERLLGRFLANHVLIQDIADFLRRGQPVAGLLLALSFIGGESAQVTLGISDKIAKVFQGILLFFILGCDTLILYRVRLLAGRAPQFQSAG